MRGSNFSGLRWEGSPGSPPSRRFLPLTISGMTLIEVFVALLILAVGVTACLRIFHSSAVVQQSSRDLLYVTGLLQDYWFDLESGEKSDWLGGEREEILPLGTPFVREGKVLVSSHPLEVPSSRKGREILSEELPPYYQVDLSVDSGRRMRAARVQTVIRKKI